MDVVWTLPALFSCYLCVLVPCMIFQILWLASERKKGREKPGAGHFIRVCVFLFYLSLVLMLTGIGTVRDIGRYPGLIPPNEIDLRPFHSIPDAVGSDVENIMLFSPFGFLLPLLWKPFRSVGKVLFSVFLFSGAIEFSQLFNRRITDIDDLIMNLLGSLAGFLLYLLWSRIWNLRKQKPGELRRSFPGWEAGAYLILSFLGVFFFYT